MALALNLSFLVVSVESDVLISMCHQYAVLLNSVEVAYTNVKNVLNKLFSVCDFGAVQYWGVLLVSYQLDKFLGIIATAVNGDVPMSEIKRNCPNRFIG